MAAARGMPIPPPDEIPPELEYKLPKSTEAKEPPKKPAETNIQHLTVPIKSRSQSYNSDVSTSSNNAYSSTIASGTSASPLFRARAKTLAALTTSSRHGSQTDLTPRELQLTPDPFVNGQPIEVYLYKDASECPICFLYYPPYLNRTRCCDQPICSECFVQIKRPDPHPPEHAEADPNAPPPVEAEQIESTESQLISEPSGCPFCVQPEFGVTYVPPPFRRGLTYAADLNARPPPNIASPVSSTSSLVSGNVAPVVGRRRATSLSASDPTVVTTDKVRPDWAQKLANARAHAARRSAAATALHTAAYLMNSGDPRGLGLGRRGLRRATGVESSGSNGRTGSPALNALAFLTDRPERTDAPRAPGPESRPGQDSAEEGPGNLAPPRASSRRSRIDDLEEMMMMEAIRLSLASEEERQRREEKEARKEAKKKEKEAKKADKAARKAGEYSNNASTSAVDLRSQTSLAKVTSSSSSILGEDTSGAGKGKAVERPSPSVDAPAASSSAGPAEQSVAPPTCDPSSAAAELPRPSHLRHMSSVSSSFSSVIENPSDDAGNIAGTDTPSLEPMFNFRSLAAVIGDEEKGDRCAEHVEEPVAQPQAEGASSSAAPSVHQPPVDATNSDPTPAVEAQADVQFDHGSPLPKELETRSVEITTTAENPETPS